MPYDKDPQLGDDGEFVVKHTSSAEEPKRRETSAPTRPIRYLLIGMILGIALVGLPSYLDRQSNQLYILNLADKTTSVALNKDIDSFVWVK
jgi:hypothetical protein